jgi:hypothetical protein
MLVQALIGHQRAPHAGPVPPPRPGKLKVSYVSIFARLDSQIRDEVIHKVIAGRFKLAPEAFEVTVTSGIVTVTGQAGNPTIASGLISAIRQIEGVIDIWGKIGYRSKSA